MGGKRKDRDWGENGRVVVERGHGKGREGEGGTI